MVFVLVNSLLIYDYTSPFIHQAYRSLPFISFDHFILKEK